MRVATYNVHDLTDDADALTHVIRCLRADVLCLQEVPRRLGAGRRLARLARETGLVVAAAGGGSGGTAVLVAPRLTVVTGSVHRLPVPHRWTRRRGFAVVVLDVPDGGSLVAVSVHLPLRPAQRLRHSLAILTHLRSAGGQVVLGADLNEGADGVAWTALARHLVVAGGSTTTPTFPAVAPRRQIDALFASQSLRPGAARLPGLDDGLDPVLLAAASDHLPLLADLHP